MRLSIYGKLLLLCASLFAGASALGEQASSQAPEAVVSLDVAIVYSPLRANLVGGHEFWMQGGSVQAFSQYWRGIHGEFWRHLGFVADVSAVHSAHTLNARPGLDLVTAAFGPRYTWSESRCEIFGQFLAGDSSGLNSVFPTSTDAVKASANSFAWYFGGGLNVRLSPRLALRAFEVDWLHTQMPNGVTGVQNNLRVGVGVIYKFK
jgi:opacity protein-like surface antigen